MTIQEIISELKHYTNSYMKSFGHPIIEDGIKFSFGIEFKFPTDEEFREYIFSVMKHSMRLNVEWIDQDILELIHEEYRYPVITNFYCRNNNILKCSVWINDFVKESINDKV